MSSLINSTYKSIIIVFLGGIIFYALPISSGHENKGLLGLTFVACSLLVILSSPGKNISSAVEDWSYTVVILIFTISFLGGFKDNTPEYHVVSFLYKFFFFMSFYSCRNWVWRKISPKA